MSESSDAGSTERTMYLPANTRKWFQQRLEEKSRRNNVDARKAVRTQGCHQVTVYWGRFRSGDVLGTWSWRGKKTKSAEFEQKRLSSNTLNFYTHCVLLQSICCRKRNSSFVSFLEHALRFWWSLFAPPFRTSEPLHLEPHHNARVP